MDTKQNNTLADLEPKEVFRFFDEICKIPHGSGNTKAISDHLAAFARERNLPYRQDDHDNTIIWKDASAGFENAPTVIIQGHMDMVCVAEDGYEIDFAKDGLIPEIKDGSVTARGTSLGGDDGIAVAMALAILDSDTIKHPPLEVVITSDEEIGMLGAQALDCSDLKGTLLLNIDSEDEGRLTLGCAGGATVTAHLPVEREKTCAEARCKLTISGLTGGHSGVEIDKERANAFVLMARTLDNIRQTAAQDDADLHLTTLYGGGKDNAIPVACEAEFIICLKDTAETDDIIDKISTCILQSEKTFQNEYHVTDKNLSLQFVRQENIASETNSVLPLDKASTDKVIDMLLLLPNGVQRMSTDIPGLVQTSLNMGILKTTENEVEVSMLVRSSVESEKYDVIRRIRILMDMLGANISISGDYPGWEYKEDSYLRPVMVSVFEKQYGRKPVLETIHAGVECGLFASKIQNLDAVSFGPDLKDIHSPKEAMDIASVKRTWDYVLGVLKALGTDH